MQLRRFLFTLTMLSLIGLTLFVVPATQGQTLSVIHNFSGPSDGANPYAGLTIDGAGNLYGTTVHSAGGYGGVFKLKSSGSGFILDPLYSFTGGSDGIGPYGRVIFGPDGSLYGSAVSGGQAGCTYDQWVGCGTIFKLQPPVTVCKTAICPWTQKVLYSFTAGADGSAPQGDLTFDAAGTIYGTTLHGGISEFGVVYDLTPSGGTWMQHTLFEADGGTDGSTPYDGVIFDTSGNLYGVFAAYGPQGAGAIYQLTRSGSSWIEHTVYGFMNVTDGDVPEGGLIIDRFGNLYGTTTNSGTGNGGTVFELVPSGGTWTYNVLYSFVGGTEDGPEAKLLMDQAGNLYGTTVADGMYGFGSVFKLTPSGGFPWTYSSLHDFTGGDDGAYPHSSLVFDSAGNLYGTASFGGMYGNGVVFEITPLTSKDDPPCSSVQGGESSAIVISKRC